MEFSMKDSYRNMVEAASGGKNTVMYDDYGNPNIMVCIPAYNVRCVGIQLDELHPAFNVEGKEVSEIWIGKYPGSWGEGGVSVSLPNANPIMGNFNNDKARELCMKKGNGWHLLTSIEWAAVMLQAMVNGHVITGCGMDKLTGKVSGGIPADNAMAELPVVKTGTGPVEWSSDGTQYGIYDMVGYMWEQTDGILYNIRTGSVRVHGYDKDGNGLLCAANMPFSNKYVHMGWNYDQPTDQEKNGKISFDTSPELGDGAWPNSGTRMFAPYSGIMPIIDEPQIKNVAPGSQELAVIPLHDPSMKTVQTQYLGQMTPYTEYNTVSLQRNINRKDDCWVDIRRGGRASGTGAAYPGMFSMSTNDSLDPEQPSNQIGDLTAPRPCWVEYHRKYGE